MKSVALIGRGAIGGVIVSWLNEGRIPGCRLVGVLARTKNDPFVTNSLDDILCRKPDLVIEAASQTAAREYLPRILEASCDCLLLSVGVLSDPSFERKCREAILRNRSRLMVSTGAIGGLDLLQAMQLTETLRSVNLVSTMHAERLVQPWMGALLTKQLHTCDQEFLAFEGTAREAASKFPTLTNVAATVGLATLGLDATRVQLIAHPVSDRKTHAIHAVSDLSDLRLCLENRVSCDNPHTSALTPMSIVRYLLNAERSFVVGV